MMDLNTFTNNIVSMYNADGIITFNSTQNGKIKNGDAFDLTCSQRIKGKSKLSIIV
jgi:hypothetical protein